MRLTALTLETVTESAPGCGRLRIPSQAAADLPGRPGRPDHRPRWRREAGHLRLRQPDRPHLDRDHAALGRPVPFLAIARSQGCANATLLQAGTPHLFGDVAATTTTRSSAEHHDHREGLQEAGHHTIASRQAARWSLSGRPDFVAAVASQLAYAGVPARMIHKDKFRGVRTTAPRHDLVYA
jgi:hypothetical protein